MKKAPILFVCILAFICGCSNGEIPSSAAEGGTDTSVFRFVPYIEIAGNNLPQTSDTSEDFALAPPEEEFPFPVMELTGDDIVKIIFTDDDMFSVLKLGATE